MKNIIKEPLLHFLIFALVILVIDNWANRPHPSALRLTAEERDQILTLESARKGAELTAEEEQFAINAFIEDELYFQDAIAADTHRDLMIYQMIIRKHKALLAAAITEPKEVELEAYFNANTALFLSPARWDIDYRMESDSDASVMEAPSQIQQATAEQIGAFLGPAVQVKLESAELETWYGPTPYQHKNIWFKVKYYQPPTKQRFADIKSQVLLQWRSEQTEQRLGEHLDQLRTKYGLTS